MKKSFLICIAVLVAAATCVLAQQAQEQRAAKKPPLSPPAETSVTIAGKSITIKYCTPSRRGRKMFGEGGRISQDPTYPVWRAGANAATLLTSDADLDIEGLTVPKGQHTIYALVNTDPWQLIINNQTGQSGMTYKPEMDLGRVPMKMSKPEEPVETYKMTLTATGPNSGKLRMEFEDYIASVNFTVK